MSSGSPADIIKAVQACPPGRAGWVAFESACVAVLEYLFVPPLRSPMIQPRTLTGMDRRDAIFPNREFSTATGWGHLLKELDARMVLCEFKNYDETDIGKDEVDQVRNYLTEPMGRLGVMVCNKKPSEVAHKRRNQIYSAEKKVILFLLPSHLEEMCIIKARGDDPCDLMIDLLEEFYVQHE